MVAASVVGGTVGVEVKGGSGVSPATEEVEPRSRMGALVIKV